MQTKTKTKPFVQVLYKKYKRNLKYLVLSASQASGKDHFRKFRDTTGPTTPISGYNLAHGGKHPFQFQGWTVPNSQGPFMSKPKP